MISKEVEQEYGDFLNSHLANLNCKRWSKVVVDFNVGTDWTRGKFYWLYAPYVCASDIFVQMDNDLVITYDINECIKNINWEDDKLFYGVEDKTISYKGDFRQTVKDFINDDLEFNKYISNYINTGLVIFRNDIKKYYNKDQLSSKIKKTVDTTYSMHVKSGRKKFRVYESDQNVLFINFKEKLSPSINGKYNVYNLGYSILNDVEIEGFHLHWWINGNKFDFVSLFQENNFENFFLNMQNQLIYYNKFMNNDDLFKISKLLYEKICIRYSKFFNGILKDFTRLANQNILDKKT